MTLTTPPHYEPTVLRRPVRYHRDASEVYHALCLGGTDTPADSVLLESVDIESKRGVKSLAILSASLRLTWRQHSAQHQRGYRQSKHNDAVMVPAFFGRAILC